MKQYKQLNLMSFNVNTPDAVCEILEKYNCVGRSERLRIYYGDTDTGRCWMDEHDIMGYIGRSTGNVKIPLLINNVNSTGGSAILDDSIVKITLFGNTLYVHPLFNMPMVTVKNNSVLFDGETYAQCKNDQQAQRLAKFMTGERNCK